ncbi:hypothetical protein IVB12_16155 [Bradyrhizobium sp. 179]|uniref:hypothetical protein n=1 Tax=Bradyrhizobium sp. 179 TaxID=2782648 RepID=UPI001FF72600|nr:hypothetical protein [Bradyrhizobium sp. 179]MCK1543275.1 hypothetical protein [Bradyrhizobium sp. 179]MCK1543451.1 hypothetical protein [Bradyrhizobium sp. 179]
MTDIFVAMNLGGSFSSGKLLAVQVAPSGVPEASFTQINYTTVVGDTDLAGAATSFAAAISANAVMSAAGIVATAVGTQIQLRATNSPRLKTVFATSPITASYIDSFCPTLASFVTGNNFLNGMVHFRLDSSGKPDWTVYNGGALALSSLSVTFKGMQINTDYIYRCVIDGQNVSGGVWDTAGNVISTASGSDSRIATWAGASCFFEGGGADLLRYKHAWATLRANQKS